MKIKKIEIQLIFRIGIIYLGFFVCLFMSSCEKVLTVDDPISLVLKDEVYKDDVTATSAITGIYANMIANADNFASGSNLSLTGLAALSSDDMTNYLPNNILPKQISDNDIHADNQLISSLWASSYQSIYQANSAIESLRNSTGLSTQVRNQLTGEALFIRAFCHFYLINMFGDVPLAISSDFRVNTSSSRISVEKVYSQIVEDLLSAQSLMSTIYPSPQRARPNKATATALLARVYLFRSDWINAEAQASLVINDNNYRLEPNLNDVFLGTSREAIWQLKPAIPSLNTWEGYYFMLTDYPENSVLTENLVNSFEVNDTRFTNWIGSMNGSGTDIYFPLKYKINFGSPITEYSMVIRLAELFLIRSEARANLNKLPAAISDLDMIRDRAKLTLINNINPNINKPDLLLAIELERRHELFTEWGHRWLDLKRTKRATTVLSPLKTRWSSTDELYPIPESELLKNPGLGGQNQGY